MNQATLHQQIKSQIEQHFANNGVTVSIIFGDGKQVLPHCITQIPSAQVPGGVLETKLNGIEPNVVASMTQLQADEYIKEQISLLVEFLKNPVEVPPDNVVRFDWHP